MDGDHRETFSEDDVNRLAMEILRREALAPMAGESRTQQHQKESSATATPPSESKITSSVLPVPENHPAPETTAARLYPSLTVNLLGHQLDYCEPWIARPVSIAGFIGAGMMPGVESVRPFKGGIIGVWGLGSAVHDAKLLTRSSSLLESTKYSSAIAADLTMGVGGLMCLAGRSPRLAVGLMAGGMFARSVIDLIPDRVR